MRRAQDPHFKASTHRRRIISRAQLADYAYMLRPGGMLYTITDVKEVGTWMREKVSCPMVPTRSEAGVSLRCLLGRALCYQTIVCMQQLDAC